MTAVAALALMATGAYALENPLGTNHGINADSMISYDSIYVGWAPNYNPRIPFTGSSGINAATGQKGATYNVYAQITSTSGGYSDPNGQFPQQDIIDSGAVLIASLMPYVGWSDITSDYCESVASFFNDKFVEQGTHVWLRYAHEMNYYATDGTYPGGDNPGAFLNSWSNMYNAVKDIDGIEMFWSPNWSGVSGIDPWWPGASQVDIVGMDAYPSASTVSGLKSFDEVYSDFYNKYSAPNNLSFALGETGTQQGSGSDTSTTPIEVREAWFKEVVNNGNYSNYPNYISATWFEYGPPTNDIEFYVIYNQSTSIVNETLSNTESGSA